MLVQFMSNVTLNSVGKCGMIDFDNIYHYYLQHNILGMYLIYYWLVNLLVYSRMYHLCFTAVSSYSLMIMIHYYIIIPDALIRHFDATSGDQWEWPERECYNTTTANECVAAVVIPGWPVVTTYALDLTQIVYTLTLYYFNVTLSVAAAAVNNIIFFFLWRYFFGIKRFYLIIFISWFGKVLFSIVNSTTLIIKFTK